MALLLNIGFEQAAWDRVPQDVSDPEALLSGVWGYASAW